MKQGWEIKKLGDIGTIITGSTPSTKDNDNYSSMDYCFVKPSDISNESISLIQETEAYISEKAFLKSRKLPKGSVLTTCIGIIGKVGILKVDATCNQQINGIIPDENCIISEFLAYSLISRKRYLQGIANAPVVPIINKKEFSDVSIPVPPLPEQEKIVSELDCLSGIIEKKRQQLKELDALAQSIFYEMFGDPVTNEKGWEVKKLGEVAIFKNGLNFKKVETGRKQLFLGVSDFKDKSLISKVDEYSSILIDEEFAEEFLLKDGDIVFVRSNGSKELVGRNVLIYTGNEKIVYSGFCIRCRLMSVDIIPLYANNLLSIPSIKQVIKAFGRGANISNLNQEMLGQIPLPLPPLPLQQSFAQKIEAIEQQKALIKQSIAEVEMLFNARMQEYFE